MRYTCASFFAGVGGIDLGFTQTGLFTTAYANEFDESPVKTFEQNFGLKVDCRDIRDIDPADLPDIDVVMGGFPCQSFSIAGYRQGFQDEKGRGTLFFELLRIIRAKKPRVVFLENVKNLLTHDGGNTLKVIMEALEDAGYKGTYRVLNAMTYGNIPQGRERIYIVAFRDEEDYKRFKFPEPIEKTVGIKDIIDFENKVDDKYYYAENKYKSANGEMFGILKRDMDDDNAVYQWRRKYVRKNRSGVVPTLTANMGGGGHNVPLVLTKHGIRKLTPHECFNAQGFPESFVLPKDTADSKLYKQAGNSVCVPVIRRIAEQIGKALNKN